MATQAPVQAHGDAQPSGFHASAFLRLALPMIVSRAGLAVMGIADGVMVARYRPLEFAWLSLAEGTLGRVLDICVAFLIGGLLLAPRLFAQGDPQGARRIWKRTLPVALGLGILGALVGLYGGPLLLIMGQTSALATPAAHVMTILGMGYPGALIAIAAAVYLEGIQQPRIVAICVVFANLLNLGLNWLLIGGHLGLPPMGARGSALSTTIMRWVLGGVLGILAWRSSSSRQEGPSPAGSNDDAATQWRLSFGAAASVGAMVALSSCLILFAGRLGALPLAIFSAAWALAGPAALITLGMADATGVLVAAEEGRAGRYRAGLVAWSCLRLSLVAVGIIALVLSLAAKTFAGFYATEPAMRSAVSALLPLVACILVVDSIGFAMASSMRAIREALWPATIEIGAMLLLVPLAAGLALWRGFGVRGLFVAMLAAGLVRAAGLALRFFWRTRYGQDDPAEASAQTKPAAETAAKPLEIACP